MQSTVDQGKEGWNQFPVTNNREKVMSEKLENNDSKWPKNY